MNEITECRTEIKWPDSINHHMQRVYEESGSFYMLDRTLDGVPPFYSFYALSFDPRKTYGIPNHIKVNGQEYWGGGLTWQQAEAIIKVIIEHDGERTDAEMQDA